jgi:flagellar hook assembly protein FlgD
MERKPLHFMLAMGVGTALVILAATVQTCSAAEDEPAVAPGEPAAPTVESLLPMLLRAHHGAPYDMAAIRFGPDFWAALQADAPEQHQAGNMLQNLFEGGLLFGVGPLDNLLAVAKQDRAQAAQPAIRWAAPPTMRATLHLQGDRAEIVVGGQRAQWVRKLLPSADPGNLLNQLEFIWFPLRGVSAGEAILGDIARSMTLSIIGLAPGATQTFTWSLGPPPIYPEGQGPPVMQPDRGFQGVHVVRPLPRGPGAGHMWDRARGAMALGGAPPEAVIALPEDVVALPTEPGAAAGLGPPAAEMPETGLGGAGAHIAPTYPVARAASGVRSEAQRVQRVVDRSPGLWESYAAVEQITRGEGTVTVDYYTGPEGRRDVEVMSRDGVIVDHLTSGPVSASGQGLATWGMAKGKADDADDEVAFIVRNTLDTPQGTQVAEAIVPVSARENRNEPAGAMAPPLAAVADLTIADISIANQFLQVRASVGVLADRQPVLVPPLHVTITDESGELVRQFDPEPPDRGATYVFAWDSCDSDGNRVPDGRYLLRIATEIRSERGLARSELRYWIEVPMEKTLTRLEMLDPGTFIALQPRLDDVADGSARFTYALPERGKVRIIVADPEGRIVRHLLESELGEGPHAVTWDGADDQGEPVPQGAYSVQFELAAGDRGAWGALTVECPLQSATTDR